VRSWGCINMAGSRVLDAQRLARGEYSENSDIVLKRSSIRRDT
jgi:hypothetical protein